MAERTYRGATDFRLAGRSWGHGVLFTPLNGPDPEGTADYLDRSGVAGEKYERPLPPWDPPADGRSPVIALLDSGVLDHQQLPHEPDDPFVAWAWRTTRPWAEPEPADRVKMAYGHATFIAGLIRMQVPAARVLSLQIMGPDGHITESALLEALDELIGYRLRGNRLDVVCMAFGEHLDAGEAPPAELREKLAVLAGQRGVRLVAAAGNAGTDEPVYPAAFAADIEHLDSVGAGQSSADRDFYSGYGEWVTHWRNGTATSIMPGRPSTLAAGDETFPFPHDGWAQWQGTSFAVARRVIELAIQPG